jgi:SPP1 family phage portal protein
VEDFKLRNNIEDVDGETGKMMSICGYGARLMYINTDGQESVLNVDPWECIFIYDGTTSQLQYALRYYPIYKVVEGNTIEKYKVEWYDNEYREVYLQQSADRYEIVQEETKPHLFDYVPLIEFPNNQERIGDFEKVAPLIDAYDKTMSDAQNEIEEFRMAYLIFKGLVPDAKMIRDARQSGAFGLPDIDMDMSFLTKNISDVLIENHKKTLNDNIYKFSKTVDMSAENFSGAAMSGEARKWKLLGLENKAITKERKFTGALINQFKVLVSAWRKKGIDIEPTDVYWEFKRNLPVELSMEAKTTSELMGKVSEETRLSLLSFIDDPKWEIEKMAAEQAMRLQAFEDVAGAGEE